MNDEPKRDAGFSLHYCLGEASANPTSWTPITMSEKMDRSSWVLFAFGAIGAIMLETLNYWLGKTSPFAYIIGMTLLLYSILFAIVFQIGKRLQYPLTFSRTALFVLLFFIPAVAIILVRVKLENAIFGQKVEFASGWAMFGVIAANAVCDS